MTPAPKGYKPVYISHIGRHGARYAISDPIYENLRKVFTDAHSAGKLTEAGEKLMDRYEAFYPILWPIVVENLHIRVRISFVASLM